MTESQYSGVKSLRAKQEEQYAFDFDIEDSHKQGCNYEHDSKNSNARNNQFINSEVTTMNVAKGDTLTINGHVGAFSVPGLGGGMHDMEERSLPDTRLSTKQSEKELTPIPITSARLVDDDIVHAVPIQNSRRRLIFIASLIMMLGVVIVAVVLSRRATKDPSLTPAENDLLEKLKPLLTNSSLQELEVPESVPSLALSWLLKKSNFTDYSFDRQVQRFAMAALYYSTQGRLWNQSKGWLVDNDECSWYQNSYHDTCVNGTLRVLSLPSNNLNGFLPKEITLLSSLEVLKLDSNTLDRSIPSELGQCTELKILDIEDNSFDGSIPSEIGELTKLEHLAVKNNALTGTIPNEIGLCTELTLLSLFANILSGSIPSSIGALTNLTHIEFDVNYLYGTIPSELCQQK